MFKSALKFLLGSLLLCNVQSASATLYKISVTTLGYVGEQDPERGTLSGFFILDTELAAADSANYTNSTSTAEIAIPNWITQASLTFTKTTSDAGFDSFTNTLTSSTFANDLLTHMVWKTDGTTFDPSANFESQMTSFGFRSASGRVGGVAFDSKEQEVYDEEFLLNASTTTEVPGPIPILGAGVLFYYSRKLRRKSFNL